MTPPKPPRFRIQYDDPSYVQTCDMGESIDDFAVKDVSSVHLERMDDNNYWMGIYLNDGTRLRFWIGHKNPRTRVNAFMEDEG